MGLLAADFNATNSLPRDFSTDESFFSWAFKFILQFDDLKLEKKAELLPEFRLILTEKIYGPNVTEKIVPKEKYVQHGKTNAELMESLISILEL